MTTGHPTRETLERLRLRTLSGQDLLSADEHLSRCAECRSTVGDSEQTSESARRALVDLDEDHLSFEEMSSYADGLGDPEQRSAAAMHMDVCSMCRTEASDLSEIPVPVVSRRRRTTSYAIAAILAAGFSSEARRFYGTRRANSRPASLWKQRIRFRPRLVRHLHPECPVSIPWRS